MILMLMFELFFGTLTVLGRIENMSTIVKKKKVDSTAYMFGLDVSLYIEFSCFNIFLQIAWIFPNFRSVYFGQKKSYFVRGRNKHISKWPLLFHKMEIFNVSSGKRFALSLEQFVEICVFWNNYYFPSLTFFGINVFICDLVEVKKESLCLKF